MTKEKRSQKPLGSPCYWCGESIDDSHGRAPTKDHVYPKSEYFGPHGTPRIPPSRFDGVAISSRNIVWACQACNGLKCNMHPHPWSRLVAAFVDGGISTADLWRKSGPRGKALERAAIECGVI